MRRGPAGLVQVLLSRSNAKRMAAGEMYNPMYEFYKDGAGTMAYRDAWSLFDQMLTSKGLVSKKVGGWQFYKAVVFRRSQTVSRIFSVDLTKVLAGATQPR